VAIGQAMEKDWNSAANLAIERGCVKADPPRWKHP